MSPFFKKKEGKTVKKKVVSHQSFLHWYCYRVYFYQQYHEPDPAQLPPVFPWNGSSGSSSCTLLWYRICISHIQHFIIGIAVALKMAKRSANAQFISFITSQSQCLGPSWAFELLRWEVAIENVGDSKTLSTYTTDDNFDIHPFALWCSFNCDSCMVASSLW